MPEAAFTRVAIDPVDLVRAYEAARRAAGIGGREWRVTPGQVLDLHRVIAAMPRQGAADTNAAETGAELDTCLNYLAPVLAESGPAKRLLRQTLAGFLGPELRDETESLDETGDDPGSERDDPLPTRRWHERLRDWLLVNPMPASGALLVVVGIALAAYFLPMRIQEGVPSDPPADLPTSKPVDARTAAGADPAAAATRAYEAAFAPGRDALRNADFMAQGGLTPRRLAALHVGRDPRLGSPDAVLAAMLRGWPVPADAQIGTGQEGQVTLRRLSAEMAIIQSGLPRVLFEPMITKPGAPSSNKGPSRGKALSSKAPSSGKSPTRGIQARSEQEASPAQDAPSGQVAMDAQDASPEQSALPASVTATAAAPVSGQAAVTAKEPWSKWWLTLTAMPFALYLVFAAATYRRRVRVLLDRWWRVSRPQRRKSALTGLPHWSAPIPVRVPVPRISRTAIRGLARYRPAPGRRFDSSRSIDALLRAAGYADPVMHKVQRAVHYLVIIQRIQPHDHERLRVRGFFERLGEMGIPITAYDYDHTPLAVGRAVAAAAGTRSSGVNGRDEPLTLPALRDLHPDARLILVTDGRDLFDLASGRIRANVVKGLGFWQERMVLTPVPVGNWGEVEYALSADLDAPLGRTGQEALSDLCRGFGGGDSRRAHRIALDRARIVSGALPRLAAWRQAVAEGFGPNALRTARGSALTFEHGMLVTDFPPDPDTIAEIRDELWLWLGRDGFLWHAACAVYPQLRYDLTVHIGQNLRSGSGRKATVLYGDTPRDRRTFERMAALPWFRTGRMPEWLRRDLLAAIDPSDLARAGALVRGLFAPQTVERQGPLAIWWPRTGALTMPPDAVMADALSGLLDQAPPSEPDERLDALRAAARHRVLLRQIGAATLVALACAAAAWLVPDFASSPHPVGAWFPLIVFVSACVAGVGVTLLARRADDDAPPRSDDDAGTDGQPRLLSHDALAQPLVPDDARRRAKVSTEQTRVPA